MQENYNNANLEVDREKLENYKKVKKGFGIAKAAVDTVGTIATIVLVAIPMDGPVGELIALAATGVLHGLVAGAEKIYDAAMDIPNPNTDVADNINDINNTIAENSENIRKVISAVQKFTPASEGRSR